MVAFQTESTLGVYDLETSSVTLLASLLPSFTVYHAKLVFIRHRHSLTIESAFYPCDVMEAL